MACPIAPTLLVPVSTLPSTLRLLLAQRSTVSALLRAELAPGDVVLVKASNAAGLGSLAEALVAAGAPGREAPG
jgi:hypothetical protein